MRNYFSYLVMIVLVSYSCSDEAKPQNEVVPSESIEPTASINLNKGDILINEFSVKSDELNEYDKKSDWIELYNTTSYDIQLSRGAWSITDNLNKPDKYIIPTVTIPSKGYLILWCDGESTYDEQIHTSFKLSGKGETLGLYQNGLLMDEVTYDSTAREFASMGRASDGLNDWELFEIASLGAAN